MYYKSCFTCNGLSVISVFSDIYIYCVLGEVSHVPKSFRAQRQISKKIYIYRYFIFILKYIYIYIFLIIKIYWSDECYPTW